MLKRFYSVAISVAILMLAGPASAAGPTTYELNVILSMTGSGAFVGNGEWQGLKAMQDYVNANGGIAGRRLSIVVADDKSDPVTALQLAQSLIAKNVPLFLGPASPQACAAIMPQINNGPLMYCLANGGTVVPGSYEFYTLFPYEAMTTVMVRYLLQHGMHRIAYIVSTDGGGQDGERALLASAAQPEFKAIELVDSEHFAPNALSADAEISRVKGARPDAIIVWASGPAAATVLRSAKNLALDIPTVLSPGNLASAFLDQYGPLLPSLVLFATIPYYASNLSRSAATTSAIDAMTKSLAAANQKPDTLTIAAWDPGMLVVDALRKLGPDATAAQLRAYLVNLTTWTGVNGSYNFRTNPQRGVGGKNIVMVRWDPKAAVTTAVSNLDGAPLPPR